MGDMNFVIPLKLQDLQDTCNSGQYVVHNVLIPQAIHRQLNDCKAALANNGYIFVLEHFDTLYSVLINTKDIQLNTLELAFTLVNKAMCQMCNTLSDSLDDEMNSEFRLQQLNAAKMLLYLLSELHRAFEERVSDHNKKSMAVDAKGRKKAAESLDVDWDDVRNRILITLFNFIQLPLSKLWEPPVPDEDFVNLAANCCYRTLEDPTIAHVRYKPMRETMCQILGTLNRRYGHGLSCTVKMVQLLKLYEHVAGPLAAAAVLFVEEYGCKNFVRDVARELDSEFWTGNTPKGCSQFLVELAEIAPNLILPIMSMIVPHLHNEVYNVRSCVLSVMGEVLSQTLSAEQLSEEAKGIRNSFLEHLEEHLWDVNALVRAKVLKIWQQLCQEKAIPLSRLNALLGHIIERLHDVSFPVTCRAVQLFTALVQNNPFGDKLELPSLRKRLAEEQERLTELDQIVGSLLSEAPEEQWNEIFPELAPVIESALAAEGSQCDLGDEERKDFSEKTLDELLDIIGDRLVKKDFARALQLLKFTEQQFHGAKELRCEKEIGWQVDYFLKLLKKIFFDVAAAKGSNKAADGDGAQASQSLSSEQASQREALLKQRALMEFLKDSVNFAEKIVEATTVINSLLQCGQTGVIQNAIEFLTAGTQFGLTGAVDGFRTMLLLVWCNESSVKEAVAAAYKTRYLGDVTDARASRAQAGDIVNRLSSLLSSLNDDEQEALEILLKEWVRNGDLPKACVQILWEKFTRTLPNVSEDESRVSLILLSMVAGAEVLTVKTNINVLVTVGLGERGFADYRIVKETCRMLLKLIPDNEPVTSNEEPFRFEPDHIIFQKLVELLKTGFWNLKDKYYLPMAQEAVDVIYQLSDLPEKTCADVMIDVSKQVRAGQPAEEEGEDSPMPASENAEKKVPLEILERFVFFIGHIAYRQWVHLDRAVFRELKRRNRIREEEADKNKGRKDQKERRRKSLKQVNPSATPNSPSLTRASETPRTRKDKDEAIDAEFPDVTADDAEAEYINQVCETQIVTNGSLLAQLSPIVVAVCTNPNKYPNVQLRSTASLALTKMMLVSSVFCEDHLQLVFTMMEKSAEPIIRSNLVYAVGDLANRFPNLIEPWTKHIYSRLRDESTTVRLSTMIVLKHLVMNEMVKVRGQISDLALCIMDDDERISTMSRSLFNELSEKGNTLYNVLPDIISCLSNPDSNVSEEKFKAILEFLMPLIQKNRLMESLVDKLCQRLRMSTSERQWGDIAFCLALVQHTDRSVRRLTENIICFSDKLYVAPVYDAFQSILAQATKSLKGEKEALVEELRSKIDDCMRRGTGENPVEENAEGEEAETAESQPKSKSKTPPATGKNKPASRKSGRSRRGRRNRKQRDSSEESSDEDSS